MTKHIRVYDNDGKTWDRYTVFIPIYHENGKRIGYDVYGMSEMALSPSGFNQYCATLKHITLNFRENRRVDPMMLPIDVIKAIKDRI